MSDRIDPRYISGQMATDTELLAHTGNTSNPHAVTKAQVGLSAVPNIDTSTTSNIIEGDKLFFTTARVLAVVLAGLSLLTATPVSAADTILVAIGKLQAQITALLVSTLPQSTGTANAAGTSGALAKADHVHNTVISNNNVGSDTPTTTTSTAAPGVLLNLMTLTPGVGRFMTTFTGSFLNSANGAKRVFVSVYVGGTLIREWPVGIAQGAYAPVGISILVNTTAGQAIEIRWRGAGGTSTCANRELSIARMS